ncbi:hypothetical protein JCM10212_002283 [Sporobolomyces blumeae]
MMSSPPSPRAASPVPSPSLALRLPAEIWFMILNQLDYAQLRKAARICKTFQQADASFVQRTSQASQLDAVLFRLPPPQPPLRRDSKISLHPMLSNMPFLFEKLDEADARFDECMSPVDYPATLDEYVTSPASTKLIVQQMADKPYTVKDPRGVTVKQLLVANAEFVSQICWGTTIYYIDSGRSRPNPWNDIYICGGWIGWDSLSATGGNKSKLTAKTC